MSNWLNGLVGTTAVKYLVAIIATYIATKLGADQGVVEGWLTQLLALLMAGWGIWESSRDKVVLQGTKVSTSDLPQAAQQDIKHTVENATGKKLKPLFPSK